MTESKLLVKVFILTLVSTMANARAEAGRKELELPEWPLTLGKDAKSLEVDPGFYPSSGEASVQQPGVMNEQEKKMVPSLLILDETSGGTATAVVNGGPRQLLAAAAPEGNGTTEEVNTDGPANTTEDILVTLDQGTLRGTKLKSRGGRDYLAFLGLPYAKPPLGDLRFKPPVKAEPWEGTLHATVLTPECIQKDKHNIDLVVKGAEDCLHLNVYTPKNYSDLWRRRNRYPVMLYIHGGGPFQNGSRYRADYFMDEEVVFITINYRLGILGNLNTNDSAARGNQGIKDQVMALRWIKENIKKFGGNPRKITLFGNSYGGMQVHAHLISPMSKGMFHRAICESGVTLVPGVLNKNPGNTTLNLAAKLNCTRLDMSELVQCLRGLSAAELIKASYTHPFNFSIEPPSENNNEDTIIPDHPLKLLQNGDINNVPTIFGVNSAEALASSLGFLVSPNLTNYVNEHFNQILRPPLILHTSAADSNVILEAAREFYLGSQNVSRATQGNFTNIFTDRKFIHPTTVSATFQAEKNGHQNKVFLYYFDWEVPKKYSRHVEAIYEPRHFLGASHADEVQFLFPYDDVPYIRLDSPHANMSLTMIKLWTSFAADGKPSGTTNEWTPIVANKKPYKFFELNSNLFQMVDPVGERMKFWDGFNLTDLYKVDAIFNIQILAK